MIAKENHPKKLHILVFVLDPRQVATWLYCLVQMSGTHNNDHHVSLYCCVLSHFIIVLQQELDRSPLGLFGC